jgi:methionyl-tRNA formyltransferase
MDQLRSWAPDLIVVAAYGQILRPDVLDLPPFGCLNVHASLLPRFRGASPIAHAILEGDAETGITIMRMDVGLDTGAILEQVSLIINPDENRQTLTERLAPLGASLLLEVIPRYLTGTLQARPQPEEGLRYAPLLKKDDGRLDFGHPAVQLERQVRAFTPWPGAFALWPDPASGTARTLKVLRAKALPDSLGPPGLVVDTPGGPAVATGAGALLLVEVQPPGKRPMLGADFERGARNFSGSRLSPAPAPS